MLEQAASGQNEGGAGDAARYAAILAELNADVAQFAPALATLVRPFLDELAQGEFSRVVALLPFILRDLLPVNDEVCHRLGLANLYSWWYYCAQDDLLDGAVPANVLLGAHLALFKMFAIYRGLGLDQTPFWDEVQRLAQLSANCYALELRARFDDFAALNPERVAALTFTFTAERAAPFYINPLAQLYLAGIGPDAPLHQDLLAALRGFAAARQIGDDANDWLSDLRAGLLNSVAAHMIRRCYAQGRAEGGLDLERLTGYQLIDEAFWHEVEEVCQGFGAQALERLSPYGDCRLRGLVARQMQRNAALWAAGRAQRAQARALFGLQQSD